jgi:hypothetical protein
MEAGSLHFPARPHELLRDIRRQTCADAGVHAADGGITAAVACSRQRAAWIATPPITWSAHRSTRAR